MGIQFTNTSIDSNSGGIRINGPIKNEFTTVPHFRCSVDQNRPLNEGNSRPINWNEIWENDGNNFNGEIFTAPIDGHYMFYCWLMTDNESSHTNDYYSISLNNNRNNYTQTLFVYGTHRGNHHKAWAGGTVFRMSAGDNVRVWVGRMEQGLYSNNGNYTSFSGTYIGPL